MNLAIQTNNRLWPLPARIYYRKVQDVYNEFEVIALNIEELLRDPDSLSQSLDLAFDHLLFYEDYYKRYSWAISVIVHCFWCFDLFIVSK